MDQGDEVLKGVGRAAGGALLFALPIFLTMEVWRLAVSIPDARIALLVVVTLVTAVGLAYYLGFEDESTASWREAGLDALVAILVGFATAGVLLWLLSVVDPTLSWRDAASIVALEALPATIGASFARSQLGENQQSGSWKDPPYTHELFLMAAGAAVFAANVAPTEEVVLVAAKMGELSVLVLVVFELALMHAFVYTVGFKGGSEPEDGFWAAFAHFTVVGFIIALAVSAYLLWTFGRFEGTGVVVAVTQTAVLALPASVGAAAARLIL